MDYYKYANKRINYSKNTFADRAKAYAYSIDEKIFNYIDFNNDFAFNSPFLTVHFFKSHKRSDFIDLRSLMYGYIQNKDVEESIYIDFNADGVGYIPNLGYFKHKRKNWRGGIKFKNGDFLLYDEKGNQLSMEYLSVIKLKNTEIEIFQTLPDLLTFHFEDLEHKELKYISTSFMSELIGEKGIYIDKAIGLIRDLMPDYYSQIISVAYGILLFRSEKLVSFASRVTPGIAYLNVQKEDRLIYFVVELVHQFGHNIFYQILHNNSDFLKIDENTPLSKLANNNSTRNLYSAFHGLFTTTQVAKILELLLKNLNLFERDEQLEIIGRFTDNYRRFRTGLEKMKLNEVFTKEGLDLYAMLDNECFNIYERNKYWIKGLITKKQNFVYNHDTFLKENSYYCNHYNK